MRIATSFAREATRSPQPALCRACVDVLLVTGAGITIMGGNQSGPVCVSNPQIQALEDLQFALGDGPCHDAFRAGVPVHVPQFDKSAAARWPLFVELAKKSNIGAVFAYPMIQARSKIGVLTLYQQVSGQLTAAQHDDSVAITKVLTETVLSLQNSAPSGTLAAGLETAVAYRAEIFQASGMVAVQLRVPVAEALVRMRAHALANDQPIGIVASEIVARRLYLDDDHYEPRKEA